MNLKERPPKPAPSLQSERFKRGTQLIRFDVECRDHRCAQVSQSGHSDLNQKGLHIE